MPASSAAFWVIHTNGGTKYGYPTHSLCRRKHRIKGWHQNASSAMHCETT
jgi:hypothetical protein